jgi:hypothetical protein
MRPNKGSLTEHHLDDRIHRKTPRRKKAVEKSRNEIANLIVGASIEGHRTLGGPGRSVLELQTCT